MSRIDMVRMGKEIKLRRIQQGISQTDFAKELGVSQTHLSNVENGRTLLGLKALVHVKNIFNCTLDELVDPDGYAAFKKIHKKNPRILRVLSYE